MAEAWIGLGSNVGDRKTHLRDALAELKAGGELKAVSGLYETEPVGMKEQGDFFNAVAGIETALPPPALLEVLLRIESRHGRMRRGRFGPRTLDLDLLLYGDTVLDEPGLRVPHPRLHERRFVLAPLAEVSGARLHPVLKMTVAELLEHLDDPSRVRLVENYPRWAGD